MSYLTLDEIKKVFHETYLIEHHDFLEKDLETLANAFIMAAMPAIVRVERAMCIDFVRSLNAPVAQALEEKRGAL